MGGLVVNASSQDQHPAHQLAYRADYDDVGSPAERYGSGRPDQARQVVDRLDLRELLIGEYRLGAVFEEPHHLHRGDGVQVQLVDGG